MNAKLIGESEIPDWLNLFRTYYWELDYIPTEPIKQFLPPGKRPWQRGYGQWRQQRVLVRIGEEIPEEKLRLAADRVAFYKQLGCKHFHRAEGRFGRIGYCAAMLLTGSGVPVAVLDHPRHKNAIYIFRMKVNVAGQDNTTLWQTDSQKTRLELIDEGATTLGKRITHKEGWETELKKWLDAN